MHSALYSVQLYRDYETAGRTLPHIVWSAVCWRAGAVQSRSTRPNESAGAQRPASNQSSHAACSSPPRLAALAGCPPERATGPRAPRRPPSERQPNGASPFSDSHHVLAGVLAPRPCRGYDLADSRRRPHDGDGARRCRVCRVCGLACRLASGEPTRNRTSGWSLLSLYVAAYGLWSMAMPLPNKMTSALPTEVSV